jgi:hypothetical protein
MSTNQDRSYFERTGKLCRKIDVYVKAPGGLRYLHSTNWHKTCRDAKLAATNRGFALSDLVARFSN